MWDIIGVGFQHTLSPNDNRRRCLQGDLLRYGTIDAIIETARPDVVIHTAALTNIDRCEREDREIARKLHIEASERIAQATKSAGAFLVHISTDQVFDGQIGRYTETSEPAPLNYYAETKLQAERAVAATGGRFLIVRTNFFGFNVQNKHDLAGWMLHELSLRNPLCLFTDITFSPILANMLVEALESAIKKGLTGVLHIASRDSCTKYAFGMMLAQVFGYESSLIQGRLVDTAHLTARRPKDMSLVVHAFETLSGTRLPTVYESIVRYRALWDEGYRDSLKSFLTPRAT